MEFSKLKIEWSFDKNVRLKKERGISFEVVEQLILSGRILKITNHPNQEKYAHQHMMVVEVDNYAYLVPFVRTKDGIFLKTVIPSRRMTKKYLR